MAVQISIYLNEADKFERQPLHIALLEYLHKENVAGATVVHAVAGFTGRRGVVSASLVDVGARLPMLLTFIDTDEHVQRVLPKLKEMAPHRLIVREEVVIEQGTFD